MVKAAKLDADGVYWGIEDRESLTSGDVVFSAESIASEDRIEDVIYISGVPDNAPGRYRWNAEQRRFDPLGRLQSKDAPDAPSFEQAFYSLLVTLERNGTRLPTHAEEWRNWFARTMDA